MATVQDIPFRRIPHQSELFLSYLDFSASALRFYQHAPTIENIEQLARSSFANLNFHRNELASILRRQNESFGCGAETLGRIGELEKADCVAVVTGQQVGLFTGPLYTIYKALTAIRIAEELNRRGVRAVPVFWLETEDHDLQEVTHRTILDSASALHSVDYGDILFKEAERPRGSVGSIKFPESIREAVRDYVDPLPDSAWKPEVQQQLESTYRPGATIAQSFAQLLTQILCGSGLILFDPKDPEAKRLTSAVYQKALREADAIREALLKRNRELEASGFHAQVSVLENSTVLFFFQDGARCALEKRDSAYGLKNSDATFSLDKLLNHARQTPEIFSPNVLLRPLIQDHLFPTVAYVGGSAELAYFAQIGALYRIFNRPMPIIWPRNSLTLIEPQIADAMDRLGISLEDCFQGKPFLIEKTLRNSGLSEAASNIEQLENRIEKVLTEIRPEMESVDPTLAQALDTARRKILHNAQHVKSHVIRQEAAQSSAIINTVDLLMNNCFPKAALQERELGIQHFWARYGPSLMDEIASSLEPGCFTHRVLRLMKRDRGIEDSRDQGIEDSRDRGIEDSRDRGIEGSRDRGIEDSRIRGIKRSRNKGVE
jgi:bacillithiol synthase